jgi:hypothetical protein
MVRFLLFVAVLELRAGHIGFHILGGDTSDLIIGENVNKPFRLVFNVVLAVSACASDPGCHAVSTICFLFRRLIVA